MNADNSNNSISEKEKIDRAILNAKASIEIEGYQLTEEMLELVRKKLMGEISEKEFLKFAIELSKRKK